MSVIKTCFCWQLIGIYFSIFQYVSTFARVKKGLCAVNVCYKKVPSHVQHCIFVVLLSFISNTTATNNCSSDCSYFYAISSSFKKKTFFCFCDLQQKSNTFVHQFPLSTTLLLLWFFSLVVLTFFGNTGGPPLVRFLLVQVSN